MTPEIPESIQLIMAGPCKDTAWAFFAFFSRFEYALKRTSRYCSQDKKGRVKPDWGKFAKFCDKNKAAVIQLEKTVVWQYLIKYPPKKQICDENESSGLGWSAPLFKQPKEPSFKWICDCLCVVRNNFFHGGKFPMEPISDPTRNCNLLYQGIALLKLLAEQDVEVRQFVYETDIV